MTADFTYFMPIAKIDKERRTVSGYASTPALDLDGEVVRLDAVKKALPGYMQWRNIREMHNPSAVGVAQEAHTDDTGLWLSAKIVDDAAWEKCCEGVYKGFSIGGRKLAKTGNEITRIELVEISVVDRPANPECKFTVEKKAKNGTVAVLAKMPALSSTEKAMLHIAKAASSLAKAGPPAAHDGLSLPAKTKCEKHGALDCEKCAMKTAKKMKKLTKRDFDAKQRAAAASSGAAMSDGSFPIKNKEDLKNAIHLAGNAKDPKAARAHIKSRAKSLGATDMIPDSWLGDKKFAKRRNVRQRLVSEIVAKYSAVNESASPSSTLLAGDGRDAVGGATKSRHEFGGVTGGGLDEGELWLTKSEKRLLKSMGVAGSLSYAFDSIRGAQRSLLMEARREGGDMKDKALALKLGPVAQALASVIGQKATHEGEEALNFSDADDQGYATIFGEVLEMGQKSARTQAIGKLDPVTAALLGIFGKAAGEDETKKKAKISPMDRLNMSKKAMKKARSECDEMEKSLRAAFNMHKGILLAKAGKRKDKEDDEFDHQEAMDKINKAAGSLNMVKALLQGASSQLKKAMSNGGTGPTDGMAGVFEVPDGVRNVSLQDLVTAGPGSPSSSGSVPARYPLDGTYPTAKFVTAEHADALAKAARAEGELDALKSQVRAPVHGRTPVVFDTTKFVGDGRNGSSDLTKVLTKGVDVSKIGGANEHEHTRAVGGIIGNMIFNGVGARSLADGFQGSAGANVD